VLNQEIFISTIKFVFRVLSYFALVVFALALPFKMAGCELLVPCQIAYFSYAFFGSPRAYYTLKSFKLVTGYQSYFA
jgi:hypothetical protein